MLFVKRALDIPQIHMQLCIVFNWFYLSREGENNREIVNQSTDRLKYLQRFSA